MRHALITVSYAADFERCALLAESVRRFVPSQVVHHLAVSRRDAPLFRRIAGPRTQVVVIEELWPWHVVELRRLRLWLSLRARPVRGWILQQLVKLQATAFCDADVLVFVDSDVAFVRPFDPASRIERGLVPLHRAAGIFQTGRYLSWHNAAARLLGLPPGYTGADYISNLVAWRRSTLESLQRHIEQTRGMHFLEALSGSVDLSEYILYGAYCDKVLGFEAAGHFPDERPLCHSLWNAEGDFKQVVEEHVRTLAPHHVALHIQSRIGVTVDQYRHLLEAGRGPGGGAAPVHPGDRP
jgi:hypothetical protein